MHQIILSQKTPALVQCCCQKSKALCYQALVFFQTVSLPMSICRRAATATTTVSSFIKENSCHGKTALYTHRTLSTRAWKLLSKAIRGTVRCIRTARNTSTGMYTSPLIRVTNKCMYGAGLTFNNTNQWMSSSPIYVNINAINVYRCSLQV